jgi:hypothetical protein
MSVEVDVYGSRMIALRTRLGFGLYVVHEDERPIVADNGKNEMVVHYFEGLVISLPFVEILLGTLWSPDPEPIET